MINEKWLPIPGRCGYFVSSYGRIRGPRKIRKQFISTCGYFEVSIDRKTLKVHRLLMLTFVGPSRLDVNHKNGIKTDNRRENLEYVTRTENMRHAVANGLHGCPFGEKHKDARLKSKDIIAIRNSKLPIPVLANKYKTDCSNICKIRRHQAWKHIKEGAVMSPARELPPLLRGTDGRFFRSATSGYAEGDE